MPASSRLPSRLPAGSKYVLESRGAMIHRYVELPNGRQIRLPARKARPCGASEVTLVPRLGAVADLPRDRSKDNSGGKRRGRVPA